MQQWFFERGLPNPHHYNQALLLETRRPLDAVLLGRAVRHLAAHHDMLRARFEPRGAGWRQYLKGGDAGASFARHDLSGLPASERRAALEAEAARLQASLHLSAGPVARFAYFDLGPGEPGRLLLVAHHLVTDGVSWRVMIEDLQAAYEQLERGAEARLPPKTTSFKEWAERLSDYARSDEARRGAEFWLGDAGERARPLPVDFEGGENLIESAAGVSVSLAPEETEALLRRAPAALDAQVNEVLLTALAQTLARWSGGRSVRISLESHGRDESIFDGVNLTRTVGWFTTIAPVMLDLGHAEGAAAELAAVKEGLRAARGRGAGYGVLRYLSDDASLRERLRAADASAVSFNYLGRIDEAMPESGFFKFAAESAGPSMARAGRRTSLLDVNAVVVGGRLRCDWSFSPNLHRRETVERLAREFADALREFAGAAGGGDHDPAAGLSDFNWGGAEAAEVAAALDELEA